MCGHFLGHSIGTEWVHLVRGALPRLCPESVCLRQTGAVIARLGGARRVGWGLVIIAGLAGFLAIAVKALFAENDADFNKLVGWSTILALVAGPLGGALVLWGPREDDVDAGARRLADKVSDQRRRFLDVALGVTYSEAPADVAFAPPRAGSLPDAAEAMLVHWQDPAEGDDTPAGTLSTIAQYYHALAPGRRGRLVILGAPGAGKSVLAAHLTQELIAALPDGALTSAYRVPVWLSLTGCPLTSDMSPKTADERFRKWIIDEITEGFGMPADVARQLVEQDRVLPVLDGLDEMAAGGAQAVLAQLNDLASRTPVILTCRVGDYAHIAEESTAPSPIVRDAHHIRVLPLTPAAVADYLRRVGRDRPTAWQPILQALDDVGTTRRAPPGVEALTNPLLLSLAMMAFRDAPDPRPLLGLRSETALSDLVAYAIPALAVAPTLPGGRNVATTYGWSGPQLMRWLTHLASTQRRHHGQGTSEYDILLPDLWVLGEARWPRLVIPALFFLSSGAALGWWASSRRSGVPLLFLTFWFSVLGWLSLSRADVQRITWPPRPRRLMRGLVGGLVGGLAVGLAYGLAGGLAYGLAGEPAGVNGCGQLLRQCLAYGLAYGLAGGLSGGLAFGLAVGLTGGLVFGLIPGNGAGWVRFGLGTALAARRGLAPHRLSRFLDWGLSVGLFRLSGYHLQFRHRDLYATLLETQSSPSSRSS